MSEHMQKLAKLLDELAVINAPDDAVPFLTCIQPPLNTGDLRALLAERTEWEALLRHAVKECDRLTDLRYGDSPFLIAYELMERIQKALPAPPEPV